MTIFKKRRKKKALNPKTQAFLARQRTQVAINKHNAPRRKTMAEVKAGRVYKKRKRKRVY